MSSKRGVLAGSMRFVTTTVVVMSVLSLLASAQYEPALPGYQYQFPRDNFDHPDYQTEWWYYTGNVKAADGRRFGFELTFFRLGVSRDAQKNATWDVRDLYVAQLALSDLEGGLYYHVQRVNRAGPRLAGASEAESRVWNGNWRVQFAGDHQRLDAISDEFALDFTMMSQKPPIIHGRNGVSQKAAGAGHASHYISLTRLLTSGSIELNGTTYTVEGTSWMDHEFFTHQLQPEQTGWDWLSLQLEDNTELMLFRIRRKDGSVDPFSAGTYVDAQGRSTFLSRADFELQPGGKTWTSAKTKATYPVEWHVKVPSLALDVAISTPLVSQEMVSEGHAGVTYWEGAIDANGKHGGARIAGVGYLEMTGYAETVDLSR